MLAKTFPENADALNNASWAAVRQPGADAAASQRALRQAEAACRLIPDRANYLNTLGVAYYRVGAWQAAAAALERSMGLQQGGNACDWLFLAMAHWKLGHKEDARQWYKQAVLWIDKNKSQDEELSRFRAEARALFELQSPEASKDPETLPRKR